MSQARANRRSSIVLAIALGSVPILVLSGCGDSSKTEPTVTPENKPTATAKDSMEFYKKSHNIPNK